MCGIAGVIGENSKKLVENMLISLKHRGPDNIGIYSDKNISIGNVLLSINGNKKQPIYSDTVLTYNGEIYNYKDFLNTDSDTETLFYLINSVGIEKAIKEIDGDYAFAYLSKNTLFLVRDPLGVKPLYYGKTDKIFAFASEKKALYKVGINEIFSVKPGYMVSYSNGVIHEKKVAKINHIKIDKENISDKLLNLIQKSIDKREKNPYAISFSGGLDSSIIAALSKNPILYSVGLPNSHDILQAQKSAELLGIRDKLHIIEISINDIEKAIPHVVKAIETTDLLQISIALPLYFTSKAAHKHGFRVIISGQGADELFAGYKRYESMNIETLKESIENDIKNIAYRNLERDDAITMANSVELRVPFLDKSLVEFALSIPPELKVHNGCRKYILRISSKKILPEEIVYKEKKAAQYSTGIFSALRKILKRKSHILV